MDVMRQSSTHQTCCVSAKEKESLLIAVHVQLTADGLQLLIEFVETAQPSLMLGGSTTSVRTTVHPSDMNAQVLLMLSISASSALMTVAALSKSALCMITQSSVSADFDLHKPLWSNFVLNIRSGRGLWKTLAEIARPLLLRMSPTKGKCFAHAVNTAKALTMNASGLQGQNTNVMLLLQKT